MHGDVKTPASKTLMVSRVTLPRIKKSQKNYLQAADAGMLRRHITYWTCLLCCVPFLFCYYLSLWNYAHLHYIPLVLVGFAILLLTERKRENMPCLLPLWLDRMLVITGACLLLSAVIRRDSGIAAFAAFFVAGAIILRFRRDQSVGRFWSLWLFLIFLLRPLGKFDVVLMHFLQTLGVKRGSAFLDAADILHVRLGNTIWASGKEYFVNEAFTGVGVIFPMLALTAWMAVLNRRPLFHSIILMCSAAFWAWAIYFLWVFAVVHVDQRLEINLLKSSLTWFAESSMFAFALFMLICTDQAIACFPGRRVYAGFFGNSEIDEDTLRTTQNFPATDVFGLAIVTAFTLLLVAQLVILAGTGVKGGGTIQFERDDLANEINGWQQVDFDTVQRAASDMRGEMSVVWVYEKEGQRAYVTVDYPFEDWHELPDCYAARGDDSSHRTILQNDEFPERVVTVDVSMVNGSQGTLAFTQFRDSGQVLEPRENGPQKLLATVRKTVRSLIASAGSPGFQVQVLHIGSAGSDRGLREDLGGLLKEAAIRTLENITPASQRRPE